MTSRPIIAARSAAGALLLAVTVAACTGGASAPTIFTPSPSANPATPASTSTALRTPTVGNGSSSATATPKPTHKASHAATATPTPRATASRLKATPKPARSKSRSRSRSRATPLPHGAPQTGGGGTAGLQDGLLLGAGGAAILAGLGSLGYRRRLRRRQRAAALTARAGQREHTAIR